MDFWAQRCLEEVAEADAAGLPHPQHTTDTAMADTIMDFLFASQDASTASLVWLTCIMADRPDILAKVKHLLSLAHQSSLAKLPEQALRHICKWVSS